MVIGGCWPTSANGACAPAGAAARPAARATAARIVRRSMGSSLSLCGALGRQAVARVELGRRIVRAHLARDAGEDAALDRLVAERFELLGIGDDVVERRADAGIE